MKRPARMRDVAELARVGTMTVSRVITGSLHVSEETRMRVLEAIKVLNYRPNEIARSLREQKTRQIGVIIPNLHDPFFALCAQAIGIVAKEHGYSVNIALSDEDAEAEYIEAMFMLQRHVQGLIVIPAAGSRSHLLDPEFANTPIVTLDRLIKGQLLDSVVVENKSGAETAVQHLIDHGHKRIAYLGLSSQLYTIKARNEGYRCAMTRADLPHDVYYGNTTQPEMLATLRSLFARRRNAPTALFCSNNLITRHTLHALYELGLSIPDQVALVGFDDFETADLLKPAITVVRQPTTEMGHIGANLLFARLGAPERKRLVKHLVLPVGLIVRGSCGSSHPSGPESLPVQSPLLSSEPRNTTRKVVPPEVPR